MKTPYTLSTDYAELFRLIQDGTVYMGIVEIKFPAIVYKHERYYRIDYEDTKRYLHTRDKPTLQDFERICKQVNLRWIKP